MDLKVYNTQNSVKVQNHKPTITVSGKNGVIRFTQKAREITGLEPTDKVEIFNDLKNPKDWYIKKTDSVYGIDIHHHPSSNFLFISCKSVAIRILATAHIPGQATFLLSKTPIEIDDEIYWLIITQSPMCIK